MVKSKLTAILTMIVLIVLGLSTACARAPTATPTTPQEIPYVVQAGENLTQIAEKCGVTEIEIMQRNQIENVKDVVEGRLLYLPHCKPSEVAKVLPSTATFTPLLPTATSWLKPLPAQVPEPVFAPTLRSELPTGRIIGSIWVNSYPPGAAIYLLPGTDDDYDTIEDLALLEYYVGNTPSSVTVKEESQLIAVLIETDQLEKIGFELPKADDSLFHEYFEFDGNLSSFYEVNKDEEVVRFAKLYRLRKPLSDTATLISVLIPVGRDDLKKPFPYIYPALDLVSKVPAIYSFDREAVAYVIIEKLVKYDLLEEVPTETILEMIKVLEQVGKVNLITRDKNLIFQMGKPGSDSFIFIIIER